MSLPIAAGRTGERDCGARKTVLRRCQRVPTGAEPREDDRDAAANCPARRKRAVERISHSSNLGPWDAIH
jgi:hypothetical protein